MANLFFAISFCFIAMLNFYLAEGYGITTNDSQNRNRKLTTPVLNSSLGAATAATAATSGGNGGDGSGDSSAAASASAADGGNGGGAAAAAAAAAASGGGTDTSNIVSSNIPHDSTVENHHQNHNLNPSQSHLSKSATPNLNSSFTVGGGDDGSSGAAAATAAAASGSGGSASGASSASGTGSNNVVSPYNNIPHKRVFGKEMVNHSVDHFTVNHPDNIA